MNQNNELVVGVCDDDVCIRFVMNEFIKTYSKTRNIKMNLVHFESGEQLLDNCDDLDVLFLDISMPGIDGIEAGRRLRKKNKKNKIIILTGNEDRFKEAFEINAYRFITKPVHIDDIFKVLDAANSDFQIQIKVPLYKNNTQFLIPQKDILYIEANGSTTIIQTVNSEFRSELSLSEWITILDNNTFFRCHRSYIVNLDKIESIENNLIHMVNGERVAISKRNHKDFFNSYMVHNP